MRRRRMLSLVLVLFASTVMPVSATGNDGHPGRPSESGNARPDFDLPAVQLRLSLDRALAEHAFLSIEAMRTGIVGGAEFEVAAEVLEANTTEIVGLVEAGYGAAAADPFAEQWRNHIAYLVDYTRAVAAGDDDARDLAASQLQTYVDDFSAFLVEANPGLPADVVQGLIQEHVQQLEQIGTFADAGFADAYPAIRDTYAHMFMVGDGLAIGIMSRFVDKFAGRETAFSPALEMRVNLDRLLGEHTYLAAIAMRARLTDAPDFAAATTALDGNSADLAAVIAEIYGEGAGQAFDELWRSHTRFYLDYVEAAADDNSPAKTQALDGLQEYRSDFSSFLAEANPFLDQGGLESLLATHTRHLTSQVSSYLNQDYEGAYGTLRQAYAHTESLAAGLAGAIADQFPRLFPDTATIAPATGEDSRPIGWLLVTAAAVGAVALSAWRRGRRMDVG